MANKRQYKVARSSGVEPRFSVSKLERLLQERNNSSKRLNSSAPVFLAGVLEYLTSNILDLAGKEAHTSGKKLIAPGHVTKAVGNNKELRQLFKDSKYLVDETPKPDETSRPDETKGQDATPGPDEK